MKGDFSRGHRPDAKRGQAYRRVLLQQGRVLLDSDIAAMADAEEQKLREAVRFAACRLGSPDLGFLVTPGALLALFDEAHGVGFTAQGGASAVRDYSRKYLGRFPGLRISGTGGTVAVNIRGPALANAAVRIWARADGTAAASVNGAPIAIPAGPAYVPVEVVVSGTQMQFSVDPARAYWIALVEIRAVPGADLIVNTAAGSYEIDGLVAHGEGGEQRCLPAPVPAPVAGDEFAAFLEIYERHITAVEDRGILEEALGGDHDTTTRTRVHAQVKLARVIGVGIDAAAAVRSPALSTGRVTLGTASATPVTDPCDLPVPGGYTGPENRLYLMEVHEAPSAGATVFKWSRDNGAELFPAAFGAGPINVIDRVNVAAHLDLRDGDLVELASEASELADSEPAFIDAGGFHRPRRAQGLLLRLAGGLEAQDSTRSFTFRDPFTEAAIPTIDASRFDAIGIKLRRWSGLLRTTGPAAQSLTLEHGIVAAVSGAFEPGDWWQYEARTTAANANGPAVATPHGPERLFAPLALLRLGAATEPFELVQWLDERFPRLCEIDADDVSYDGDRAGSQSATVQEALDELFTREQPANCGEIIVMPGQDLQAVFDAIPVNGNARICLAIGEHLRASAAVAASKGEIIVTGNGAASVLRGSGTATVLRFEKCGSVSLRDFRIVRNGGTEALLDVRNCPRSEIRNMSVSTRAQVPRKRVAIRIIGDAAGADLRTKVSDCVITVENGDTGIVAINQRDAILRDNRIGVRDSKLDLSQLLMGDLLAARLGRLMIDDIVVKDIDRNLFVGSPVVNLPNRGGRSVVASSMREWGNTHVSFTTSPMISADVWLNLIEANPIRLPGQAGPVWVAAELRRLRKALIRSLFPPPVGAPAVISPAARERLAPFANAIGLVSGRPTGDVGLQIGLSLAAGRPEKPADAPVAVGGSPKCDAHISGNRISGFRTGIHVGASNNKGSGSTNPDRTLFANEVAIDRNIVEYHGTNDEKNFTNGIFVGNAISVSVSGNRVEAVWPVAGGGFEPYAIGVALHGFYGPLQHVVSNFCVHGKVGVRVRRLNPLAASAPGASWKVADNAYFGTGTPLEIL